MHFGYFSLVFRYGEFTQLCGTLTKYIRPSDSVLVAGCGNSDLSANLYDIGFRDIANVDISETVIKQMSAKNADQRPDMKFIQMDLLQVNSYLYFMPFELIKGICVHFCWHMKDTVDLLQNIAMNRKEYTQAHVKLRVMLSFSIFKAL